MSLKMDLNAAVSAYIRTVKPLFARYLALAGSTAARDEKPGIDAQIAAAQRIALDRVDRAISDYLSRLDAAFAIRGSRVNQEDLVLLSDAFDWSQEQFDEILERNRNNPVMMQAVRRYAKAHDLLCPDTDDREAKRQLAQGARRTAESYIKNSGAYSVHAFADALADDGLLFNELTNLTE